MRILIVGATGQVGQLTVHKALDVGHTVTAFARWRKHTSEETPQARTKICQASSRARGYLTGGYDTDCDG